MQISIISSSGMLLKRGSTARLPMEKPEPCPIISSVKTNESFTWYSLLFKDFKIGTKNFAYL